MRHPTHLNGYASSIGSLAQVLPGRLDDSYFGYKVVCSCSGEVFSVKKNDRPLVIATCKGCQNEIVLYDTNQYPDATPCKDEGPLVQVIGPEGESDFLVCVAYEYPEDDDEEEYTNNDISWCYIYGVPEGLARKSFCVINDETM